MDFRFEPEAEAFRAEVRAFIAEHLSDEIVDRALTSGTMHDWGFHRALCERGYLAAGWPVEVGGLGRSAIDGDRAPRGFRATSGIIVGTRQPVLGSTAPAVPSVDAGHENSTVPYLGVGYSSLVARSGWSFSADLGVVSRSPGSVVRLGRVFNSAQSLDDVLRDMRLAPHVQLGVSYSF
jgi:hypothetical protein